MDARLRAFTTAASKSKLTSSQPPFFACFERAWAQIAYIVDPQITRISAKPFEGWSAVAFQRSTVILSELVLAAALLACIWAVLTVGCKRLRLYSYSRSAPPQDRSTAFIIAASVLLHPGLILVDHIHFQYNGFLLGILTWNLLAAGGVRHVVLFGARS